MSRDQSMPRTMRLPRCLLALYALLLAGGAVLLPGASVRAATTYTVNALTDTGVGSGTTGDLRYAVNQVNAGSGGDTITITVTGTITLTQGTLTLTKNVTITGPGPTSLALDGGCTTCSAGGAHSDGATIISIPQGITVSISGLTFQHGNGTGPCFVPWQNTCGGGIDNSGTLTVTNCTFTANYAQGGGGIWNGGTVTVTNCTLTANHGTGLDSYITATVTDSTFSGNDSGIVSQYGSGPPYYPHLTVNHSTITGNTPGGGIIANGTLTMTDSTLSNNFSNGGLGGGIDFYGDYGTLTVTDSTFSGNTEQYCYLNHLTLVCYGSGGGIYYGTGTGALTVTNSTFTGNGGGAIVKGSGTLTVTNSAFSRNGGGLTNSGTAVVTGSTITDVDAPYAWGISNTGTMAVSNSTLTGNGGGIQNTVAATLTVTNSTIAGNYDGIYNKTQCTGPPCPHATVNLTNTIVAQNTGGDLTDPDAPSDFIGYFNLIDDAAHAASFTDGVQGNIVGHTAGLGTLSDYGGPTETMPPLPGSPAIDAAAPVGQGPYGNTVPATDQRGVARPQGSAVDIGAVEVTPPNALPTARPIGASGSPAPVPVPRTSGVGSGATSGSGSPSPAPAARPVSGGASPAAPSGPSPNPAPPQR